MKCPRCGSIIPESTKQCGKCAFELSGDAPFASSADTSSVADLGFEALPPWRREVAKKVRAYGERKKKLITPSHPIRETTETTAVEKSETPLEPPPSQPAVVTQHQPLSQNIPHTSSSPSHSPSPTPTPSRTESWMIDRSAEQEIDETPSSVLLLGRRTKAFILDTMIVIVLYFLFLYLGYRFLNFDFRSFLSVSWKSLLQIFLLTHFLYYLYFYKISRQTPGQVFFALELRDPFSSQIGLGKILLRWLCLVFLNILNLLPLLTQHKFLLLDRLSGTEIRSLK